MEKVNKFERIIRKIDEKVNPIIKFQIAKSYGVWYLIKTDDNAEKELKNRKNSKLMKYFALATNMVYILALPILIMLGFYLLLKKYLFKTDQPIVLIIFLILGAISGYWSLIKQINNIK